MRRARGIWRGIAAATALALSFAGCRQILGIDDDLPLVGGTGDGGHATDDAGPGGADASGGGGAGPSAFEIVHAVPEGETLYGVWGTGPEFVMAVGSSKLSYVSRNGALTRLGGFEKGTDYMAVWGTSEFDVYACGETADGGGFVDHFDGSVWKNIFETSTSLYGIWGPPDGSAVIAVGAYGKGWGYHPGSGWTQLFTLPKAENDPDTQGSPHLWSISGRSLTDFSIAAESRLYHTEPNEQFAFYELTTQEDTLFRAVWQAPTTETSIYIGGNFFGMSWFSARGNADAGYPLSILGRDATVPNAAASFLQGIWSDGVKVIGVGDSGRMYVYDTGLSELAPIASPTDDVLAAVWGSSADDVWVVGHRELILHGSIR